MPKVGQDLPKEQREAGLKRLKPQQQQFLDYYLHKDMTQTEAARQSGYKNPTVQAVRLLRNPVVAERLQEMRLEAASTKEAISDKLAEFKRLAESRMKNVTLNVDVIDNKAQDIAQDS